MPTGSGGPPGTGGRRTERGTGAGDIKKPLSREWVGGFFRCEEGVGGAFRLVLDVPGQFDDFLAGFRAEVYFTSTEASLSKGLVRLARENRCG